MQGVYCGFPLENLTSLAQSVSAPSILPTPVWEFERAEPRLGTEPVRPSVRPPPDPARRRTRIGASGRPRARPRARAAASARSRGAAAVLAPLGTATAAALPRHARRRAAAGEEIAVRGAAAAQARELVACRADRAFGGRVPHMEAADDHHEAIGVSRSPDSPSRSPTASVIGGRRPRAQRPIAQGTGLV
jgi:hypothetical protein